MSTTHSLKIAEHEVVERLAHLLVGNGCKNVVVLTRTVVVIVRRDIHAVVAAGLARLCGRSIRRASSRLQS